MNEDNKDFKAELMKLIQLAHKEQEVFRESQKIASKVFNLESIKKQNIKEAKRVSEEEGKFFETLYSSNDNDIDKRINSIKNSADRLITKDEIDEINDKLTQDYMEMSKKHGVYDVAFQFDSRYPGGSETFRTIIEDLNKEGANIGIVYDKPRDLKRNELDASFLVVMPSASYAKFNNKIHEDQEDSRNDVIGHRRECFFLPVLNKKNTLDDIKNSVEKMLEEDSLTPLLSFRFDVGMGYSELLGSNYHSEEKILRGINNYISQIEAIELSGFDGNVYHNTVSNIMTSSAVYNRNSENEFAGNTLTPLKEAIVYEKKLEESNELKEEGQVKKKKKKHKTLKKDKKSAIADFFIGIFQTLHKV